MFSRRDIPEAEDHHDMEPGRLSLGLMASRRRSRRLCSYWEGRGGGGGGGGEAMVTFDFEAPSDVQADASDAWQWERFNEPK